MSFNPREAEHTFPLSRGELSLGILSSARNLVAQAREDALGRISVRPEIQHRIERALEARLFPYVVESEVISEQLSTSEYQTFTERVENYLRARTGAVVCPDGRIIVVAIGDPKIMHVHRRLQGFPEVRPSTRESKMYVLNDPYLSSSIEDAMTVRKENGLEPLLVESLGPHIHSKHPSHGCGGRTGEKTKIGHTPEIGMELGGIRDYFEELRDGFFAFDNAARNAGARGSTVDMVHDAYTQGLIYGLRKGCYMFDEGMDLRKNLERLEKNKVILMTESLDELFGERIYAKAAERNIALPLDISDFNRLAENTIAIGTIALELTMEEEKKEFSFIPRSIREDKTDRDLRVLAYNAIRNSVYRLTGNIKPGKHDLEEHPEVLIRIGPIGADFNVNNIPFIESTTPSLREKDLQGLAKLYELSYNVAKIRKVDLRNEGRIILVTGEYEPEMYADVNIARREFVRARDLVRNNAARVREMFRGGVQTGETIVVGCLHEPETRRLTHIV